MIVLSIDVGIVNLAFCVYDSSACNILFWKIFRISPIGGDMCRGICEKIGELTPALAIQDIDKIVIEMQPGRNQRMKAVQHFLHMYFVAVHQKPVVIFSARHKLAGTGFENSGRDSRKYRLRKKASVELCKQWLDEHPDNERWNEMFYKKGFKKDDAADSLNQAIAFCSGGSRDRGNTIPDDSKNTIDIVRPRKPTAKQLQRGIYSKSNMKHIFLKEWKNISSPDQLKLAIKNDKKIKKSIDRLYRGNVEECIEQLWSNKK
jgi:hypothetical protein